MSWIIRASAILCVLVCSAIAKPTTVPSTIEHVHSSIVPHTDKNGHVLTRYDAEKSFFPIGLWGQVLPESTGGPYPDWKEIAAAGFNTIWPINWDDKAIPLAEEAKIQLVYMGKIDEARAKRYAGHPNLLGNMWRDEPTGLLNNLDFKMEPFFQEFLDYKKRINEWMPGLPVFINDPPAIFPEPPKFKQWWIKWNTAGDVSCQDDYPIIDREQRARSLANEPTGIPQDVSLAVKINDGKKPCWLIIGAFDSPTDPQWPFRMPTPRQLRAEIYTAIISGATGVQYFIMDSHKSREGAVVGMSPRPKVRYVDGEIAASPAQMIQGKSLWEMAIQINSELRELTPVILSPTAADIDFKAEAKCEPVSASPLHCMLKRGGDGKMVLMTVNVDDAVLNASFSFPMELKRIEPLYENRAATGPKKDKRSFDDRYEPFEVHVYRLTPATQPSSAPTSQPAG